MRETIDKDTIILIMTSAGMNEESALYFANAQIEKYGPNVPFSNVLTGAIISLGVEIRILKSKINDLTAKE